MKIEIPGKTLKQITKLDLSNKDLVEFPEDLFECINLRKLILSHNKLTYIPKKINVLKKLKVLDLSYNRISTIYANVYKLPKLTTLNVSNNELSSIPKQLYNSNIRVLIINNNSIASIDEKNISKLERLNISNNNLSSFIISSNLTRIRQLWIGNNPLLNLDVDLSYASSLEKLYAFASEHKPIYECDELYKILARTSGNSFNILASNQKNQNMKPSKSVQNNIFISYSRGDKVWLEKLETNLKALKKTTGNVVYWDDTKIKASDNWKEEIDKALESANVAILLVSVSFLASDFIQNHELPKLLEKANNNGTKIYSLILDYCMFKEQTNISKYESVNPPEKPFSDKSIDPQFYMNELMKDISKLSK